MKALRLLVLGVLLSVSFLSKAQVRLGIDTSSATFNQIPPTAHIDSVIQINIGLWDSSNVAYTDGITLRSSINGLSNLHNDSLLFGNTSYNDTIPAFGGITKQLTIHFDPSVFVVGPSVIVIWPIGTGNMPFITADSLKFTIILSELLGIEDPELKNIKAYMINDQLQIISTDENLLGHVRIFDVQGALLADRQIHQSSVIVPMERFASGVYLAEVTLADNRKQLFKVFKGK